MNPDNEEVLRRIQAKLSQRMAEVRAANLGPAFSLEATPEPSSTDDRVSPFSPESLQETIVMRPRQDPCYIGPSTSDHSEGHGKFYFPSSLLIRAGICASFFQKTSDFHSPVFAEVNRFSTPSFDAQVLTFDQLLEILNEVEQSRDHAQMEVRDLKDRLRAKEKQCSSLGLQLASLSGRIRELDIALEASLGRTLEMKADFTMQMEQLTLTHKQELERSRASSFVEGKQKGSDEGISRGIQICRSHFLMSPYGQAFIDSLMKQLPEAYINSRMINPLTDWAGDVVFECCNQLGVPGSADYINLEPIIHLFATKPEALKRNCFIPTGEPWFMPMLRKASEALRRPVESFGDFPPWDAPPFPLFPIDTTAMQLMKRAFDEELAAEKIASSSSSRKIASAACISPNEEGGSDVNDIFNVPLGRPRANWILPSTDIFPAFEGEASASKLPDSEDLTSTPDPTL